MTKDAEIVRDINAFPEHFLWGASVASHQVEGGNNNQWSAWELKNAGRLAKTAPQRFGWLRNWKEIESQACSPQNYISGSGVDHYNRYREDFDIVRSLHLNAFRFTLEWSRIEPREGEFNQNAIEHYRNYIKELLGRNITPVLNIWHWTHPAWFEAKGGFEHKENLKYFERFVRLVADEFLDGITHVLTLNEPNVYASFGYWSGEWPPQQKSPLRFMKVYRNLTRAHNHAYNILKKAKPSLKVGFAAQLANIQAKRPRNFVDIWTTKAMRYAWNWWFLDRCRKAQDFIGINYYFTDYFRGVKRDNPKLPTNDLGWYMEPEGLYPLLRRVHSRYGKPIMITENGLADMHDQKRRWWIEETIIAMERALSEGVDLLGYLHWSLLDNFEWSTGWWPKFGLVAVDRQHGMKRNVRSSARWFSEQIKR